MRDRDDRHLRLGAELADLDEDAAASKFADARVVLTWNQGDIGEPGAQMVLLAANLIARFCPRIHVLGDGDIAERALGLLRAIDHSEFAEFTTGSDLPADVKASVHLGGAAPLQGLPHLTTA